MLHSLLKFRQLGKVSSTEPVRPFLATSIPGPNSLALLSHYQGVSQEHKNVKFFVDYEKSIGNYMADADKNLILDLDGQDGTSAIGYNHPSLAGYINSSNIKRTAMHRISCHTMPLTNWPELIDSVLLPLAPVGLGEVFNSCGCSAGSLENAAKSASIWYYKNKYGVSYTAEQLNSAFENKPPGTPDFSLITLSGSKHSNLLGLSNPSPYLPRLNFGIAPFPTLKYPGDNRAAESQALEATRALFKSKGDVFGLIIEPIQRHGNNFASSWYYKELSKIAKEFNSALIIDETFSGFGATGLLWAHEHFDIHPDILVYGGKTQISGYFMKPEFRPPQIYQVANTWCGDALKLEQLKFVRSIIESNDLISNAASVGQYLLSGIREIQERFKKIENTRGLGLLIAFDFKNKESTWKFVKAMLDEGVLVNVTGNSTVQLSPALVFDRVHADVFLEAMTKALSN